MSGKGITAKKYIDPSRIDPRTGTIKPISEVQESTEVTYANLTAESVGQLTDASAILGFLSTAITKKDNVLTGLLKARLDMIMNPAAIAVAEQTVVSREDKARKDLEEIERKFAALVSAHLDSISPELGRIYGILGFKKKDGQAKESMSMITIDKVIESGKDFLTVSCLVVVKDKVPVRSLTPLQKAVVTKRRAQKVIDKEIARQTAEDEAKWQAELDAMPDVASK